MKVLHAVIVVLFLCLSSFAQDSSRANSAAESSLAPRMIRFSGQLNGMTGTVGITFTLHKSKQDNAILWMETQNVKVDATGKYSVLLGANNVLPDELFTSSEAQWLAIRVQGQMERRVLLTTVPYAIKATEADKLAGRAASEFVTTDRLTTVVREEIRQQVPALSAGVTASGVIGNAIAGSPTNFTGTTTDRVVGVSQSGTGYGISADAVSGYAVFGRSSGTAVFGISTATATTGYGVYGTSYSSTGYGVFGSNTSTTGTTVGVRGNINSNSGIAVYGTANTPSGTASGVKGVTQSPDGYGVFGQNSSPAGAGVGVRGSSVSTSGIAVYGTSTSPTGATKGMFASVASPSGTAALFQNTASGKLFSGIVGVGAGTEVFSVAGNGDVATAGKFIGDGSSLTNVNAVSATTAGAFTGSLAGDINGTQSATSLASIQGTALSAASPAKGAVIRFNGNVWNAAVPQQHQWFPVGMCAGNTPYPAWGDLPGAPTTFSCRNNSNARYAVMDFVANETHFGMFYWKIPANWDGQISVTLRWLDPSGTAGSATIAAGAICLANGTSDFVGGIGLNGTGITPSDSNVYDTTANVFYNSTCNPGDMMMFQIGTFSPTMGLSIVGAEITYGTTN